MSPHPTHPRRSPLPGLVRAGVVAAILAIGLPASAQAAAPRTARVCAPQVLLVESPGGAVTGIVHHYDLLRVLQGGARASWWRVATSFGARGWLHRRTLCGRDR
jgi:hypothetical protein